MQEHGLEGAWHTTRLRGNYGCLEGSRDLIAAAAVVGSADSCREDEARFSAAVGPSWQRVIPHLLRTDDGPGGGGRSPPPATPSTSGCSSLLSGPFAWPWPPKKGSASI